MGPFAAIFFAVFWCAVALLIIWSRGYSPGAIALCLVAILAGGGLGALPGAYALTHWSVIADDGGEAGQRFTAVACGAVFVGALCGLFVAERLRERQFLTARQLLNACIGFLLGGMCGYVLIFLSHGTWAQSLTSFGLFPATVSTAILAGSAMGHPLPDLK